MGMFGGICSFILMHFLCGSQSVVVHALFALPRRGSCLTPVPLSKPFIWFEPLLEWVNETLGGAKWLSIFGKSGNRTTARLIEDGGTCGGDLLFLPCKVGQVAGNRLRSILLRMLLI
jgi:hypothetical protein